MDEILFNFDVLFLRHIAEQKEAVDRIVSSGQCTDHTEYVRLTSRRHGLEIAENYFKSLITQWQER